MFVALFLTEFEEKLNRVIKEGKVKDILDIVTPRNLANCKTNSLMKALEVCTERFLSFLCILFENDSIQVILVDNSLFRMKLVRSIERPDMWTQQ